ncbi:MAG: alginate lyase family protein [Planctomycetales bacterium]|nr:alginate lyase family protein [Planctomycetales bacterium]
MISRAMQLLHTVRHLRRVQIATQVQRRLVRGRPDRRPAPPRRALDAAWVEMTQRIPRMTGPQTFRFLEVERTVDTRASWDEDEWQRLWAYNLHYFEDLTAENAEQRRPWHAAIVDDWVAANPPAESIGWDPYPLSMRITNWIKWSLGGGTLSAPAVDSIAVQLRWLTKHLEYRLLANHLLANAKALVFGGTFFDGAEADEWLELGIAILAEQVPEQILPDGGHIERSPMYHSVIAADVLDLVQLAERCGRQIAALAAESYEWKRTASQMLGWLQAMSHPDGEIALLNDAAFDIAPRPQALYDYAAELGIDPPPPPGDGIVNLEASGYLRLERGPAVLICDAAPLGPDYQPGHGHADALTFEMSLGLNRFIVDTGTSRYDNGAERLVERGTAAHNTVEIDSEDSSEIWSSFRVARRVTPKVLCAEDQGHSGVEVEAGYDGFERWTNPGGHVRRWRLGDGELEIIDTVTRRRFDSAVARFHLHPDVRITDSAGTATLAGELTVDQLLRLVPGEVRLDVGNFQISFSSDASTDRFVAFEYHPMFGVSQPSVCIECELQGRSNTFRFTWSEV